MPLLPRGRAALPAAILVWLLCLLAPAAGAQTPGASPGGAPTAPAQPAPAAPQEPAKAPQPAVTPVPVPAVAAPPSLIPRPPALGAPQQAQPDPAAQRAQIDALVRTLQDDKARAQLIEQLRGLSAAQPAAEQGRLPGLIERLQEATIARVQVVAASVVDLAASVEAIPELAGWLQRQLTDDVSRVIWWTLLSQIGLAGLLGVAASLIVRAALRRWRQLRTQLPPSPPLRAKLAVAGARLFVDVAGLGAFAAVSYAALEILDVTYLARVVALDLIDGALVARAITGISRAALATSQPRARLLPLSDRQARITRRWISWISGLAIYGSVYLDAAQTLGLPWTVYAFLQHLLFLIVTVLLIVAVFRVRRQLAALLRGLGDDTRSEKGHRGWLRRLVPWQSLAAVAPYAIAGWVVLQYLVWALRIPAGTAVLTRGTAGTILALVLLRAFGVGVERLLGGRPKGGGPETGAGQQESIAANAVGATADEHDSPPVSAARTLAVAALRVLGAAVAAVLVLEAWGFHVTGWLNSATGRDVLARLLGFLSVAALAGLAWYGVDRTAQRYMSATDEAGNLVHNNRTRTLANIVRNLALVVTIFVVAGHLLAELGVNTAAILAGAGVVGFAIGFGSQKLVQDLTTGLFILLGDTVRVGDVVKVGDRSGVVEAVSMRTVTLRDYNGEVHTIPYSSISIVSNMTKDYAYAVFNVTVGYREDVDRVMDVLREIDSQMRREWPYRRIMQEPLDMAGVDSFTERGVVILARSRTRAGEQWKVAREFNRRMKKRFDELGIEFPFPQQMVHVTERQTRGESAESAPRRFSRPEVVRAADVRGGSDG